MIDPKRSNIIVGMATTDSERKDDSDLAVDIQVKLKIVYEEFMMGTSKATNFLYLAKLRILHALNYGNAFYPVVAEIIFFFTHSNIKNNKSYNTSDLGLL